MMEASEGADADDCVPIEVLEIDQPIMKNGVPTGRLRCKLEVWWINAFLGGSPLFAPLQSFCSSRDSQQPLNVVSRRRVNGRQKQQQRRENV
jgi:hypothetical protein